MWGAFALAFAGMAFGATPDMRIQFAEKVSVSAAPGHTEFDAYGRRFSLDLQANERLLHSINSSNKQAIDVSRLLRGTVRGAPGSWVRLARVGDSLEGAIWDGHDVYVVTSKRRIEASLTLAIEGAPSQTVVYRLSDTIGGLPDQFCGLSRTLPRSPNKALTGLDQYQAMVAELRLNAASLTATEQLDIALIADTDFQTNYGSSARDTMLAELNTMDGIFGDQVGVLIAPTEIRLVAPGADPFTTNDPEALLGQVSKYREGNAAVKAPGLAHLMTGKDLDGNTIGIAFIDSLCDPSQGVSLSDNELGPFTSALVMAHELGHNFGAPHDGAAGSACAATPQNFLMAPTLNGSMQFSQCSLAQMQVSIARARNVCIGALHYGDVSLEFPATPPTFNSNEQFSFPVTVRSVGTATASNVTLRIDLPAQITFQSAVLTNGSCSASGSTVTCQLGDLAAGVARPVDLRLISSALGSYYVSGLVAADNDIVQSNNTQNIVVGLQSAVDLGVTLTTSAPQVFVSDTIDFTVDIASTRSQLAHGGRLFLYLNSPIESFVAGAHACQLVAGNAEQLSCDLADVPAHATTRITVRTRPNTVGVWYASASVTIADDGEYSNNSSNLYYTVRAEREVVTTASSEDLRVVVGTDNNLVLTSTSVGRLAATNVQVSVGDGLESIQSVVPDTGTCTHPGPNTNYTCNFGTMNPGDTHTITVRFRMAAIGQSAIVATTQYMNGATPGGSTLFARIYANIRVDAQLTSYSAIGTIEEQPSSGGFELQSIGIDPAQNVVATLDVPAPVRLTDIRFTYNPQGFQCEILTPQRARCTGSFGIAGQSPDVARIAYDVISSTSVTTQATISMTAAGDGNPANDTAQTNIFVKPIIEVNLASTTTSLAMVIDHVTSIDLTFSTGRNPVQGAFISAYGSDPYYAVDSISFNNVDCPRASFDTTTFGRFVCAVGDLPANGTWPVTVRYRGYQGGVSGGIYVDSGAMNLTRGRTSYVFSFSVGAGADMRIAVAQPSATAVKGSQLQYPMITVWSMGSSSLDVDVDIPLPPFTTLNRVDSNGVCSGTTTLRCHYAAISGGTGETISIFLDSTNTGTFTSSISARAATDSSAGNNGADVSLTVTAAPTGGGSSSGGGSGSGSSGGGSSSGGGKGGGGRMEWLALAFLGLLAMRRAGFAVRRYK